MVWREISTVSRVYTYCFVNCPFVFFKALNHLLSIRDDDSENADALNLAVDVVGAAGDTKLTNHLMSYLLGDVDGTPKVATARVVLCIIGLGDFAEVI